MLGKKEGLATREEIKFFVDFAVEETDLNMLYKTGIKIVVPALVDSLDNKVGDKLPEPWQTYCEDMITSIYEALQDKVLTDEEIDGILSNVATILAAEIDVPLIEEADEVEAFEYLMKYLAVQVRYVINKRKENS